ncbi:4-alpha-L-fucosyltransferase [Testudinibacter sp. TR-2022]|uniref:TDP-N-acetylfucosamine:lipid II N-acetylfucosaminyltransferase n=1 Tax=Testudinibacter sp. TR-2022 TaxID=2585029 RepID=UPI00111A8050|nr:TDP-N-acetylfucosamine:lipid II N-acetylfucosaminyltransferase [Testudinibacter sp. TR-2022]TNH04543.1 4-alpha-L-fucosyltransferase [Pasteurellaceae bacterium Phil31]TNH07808.1 4-alpha-L-fucosyltransferase [Testudinibacter sp. TR-2022]TNH11230.1 4-alpha-L-fucosyltransferase [Testudinibacter sp. TR-2022]TNH14472.1 4-alpha-L-fucosyltransferase [Testudinibacter sp. TR-2022]TNH14755.1 4-alpha-L-fucosyltransferase [Testudinibacter sp. TR-2022]
MRICHIFGSNIPHHNQTVMAFFREQLWERIPSQARAAFYIVGGSSENDPPEVKRFASKKALANFLIKEAKQRSDTFYLLHGQFNVALWLAILCNKLPLDRIGWHIWGADLYEDSNQLQFKLFYPLRRMAQKKLRYVFATAGDLQRFSQINSNAEQTVLYFPTKMDPSLKPPLASAVSDRPLTILLGNSGDPSNRHVEALQRIKAQLGEQVQILIPMGYPEHNQAYINTVKSQAAELFAASAVTVFEQRIDFQDYLSMLAQCDAGYFIFSRQQGIGTICLLTQFNVPLVLNCENPFCLDMQQQQIPFVQLAEVSRESLNSAKVRLSELDKTRIDFFAPNFVQGWLDLLQKLAQK